MPKVHCQRCRRDVFFLRSEQRIAFLFCPTCNTDLAFEANNAARVALHIPLLGGPAIEAQRMQAPAWMLPTGSVLLLFGVVLGAAAIACFYSGQGEWFSIAFALGLGSLIFSAILLSVALPPVVDRGVKLRLDRDGLHDFRRRPVVSYHYSEIEVVRMEASLRHNVVVGGKLRLGLTNSNGSPRRAEVDCTGLDRNVEELFLIVEARIADARLTATPRDILHPTRIDGGL